MNLGIQEREGIVGQIKIIEVSVLVENEFTFRFQGCRKPYQGTCEWLGAELHAMSQDDRSDLAAELRAATPGVFFKNLQKRLVNCRGHFFIKSILK